MHIGDDVDQLSEEEEFAARAQASVNSKLEQWDAPSAVHFDEENGSYDILEAQRAALEQMSGKFVTSSISSIQDPAHADVPETSTADSAPKSSVLEATARKIPAVSV